LKRKGHPKRYALNTPTNCDPIQISVYIERLPFTQPSKIPRHAFSVVEPTTWYNLPSDLHALLATDVAYTIHKHLQSVIILWL